MQPALLPISAIVEKLGISERYVEPSGRHGAKIRLELAHDPAFPRRGKLILVTATTPTKSGEGKTVTSIGLAQGLDRLGKRAIVTSREPSLGPVFGMKGGAAGGGLSQVEPAQKINLHLHGDFHAIAAAHNLLAAVVDSHLHFGNALDLDPDRLFWPRAMDMNDRALRRIRIGLGGKTNGPERDSGFVITAASEVMAIFALAKDLDDLRSRLDSIVVGLTRSGRPVHAAELETTGGMMALLADAIMPNLVQTTEGTPAFVHAGPFANIAHGTSSILSQDMALRLADYVVNETGFASDLGAEKYVDLVMRISGIAPSAAVLVTTVDSLRAQGDGDLRAGLPHLEKHLAILAGFGLPAVVAINHFPKNSDAELEIIADHCDDLGVRSARVEAFARGGAGALALAEQVVALLDHAPAGPITPAYRLDETIEAKIAAVARQVYGASDVSFSDAARERLASLTALGFAGLPICIAKTQYSLSDDPSRRGVPTGWTLRVSDILLSAGAGFLVVVAGAMNLMPGLPRESRVRTIDFDPAHGIIGV